MPGERLRETLALQSLLEASDYCAPAVCLEGPTACLVFEVGALGMRRHCAVKGWKPVCVCACRCVETPFLFPSTKPFAGLGCSACSLFTPGYAGIHKVTLTLALLLLSAHTRARTTSRRPRRRRMRHRTARSVGRRRSCEARVGGEGRHSGCPRRSRPCPWLQETHTREVPSPSSVGFRRSLSGSLRVSQTTWLASRDVHT